MGLWVNVCCTCPVAGRLPSLHAVDTLLRPLRKHGAHRCAHHYAKCLQVFFLLGFVHFFCEDSLQMKIITKYWRLPGIFNVFCKEGLITLHVLFHLFIWNRIDGGKVKYPEIGENKGKPFAILSKIGN